jgi:hypothetical protein
VTYIEFRLDPKTVNTARNATRQEEAKREEQEQRALKRATDDLMEEAVAIQDEDLRRRFLLAAGSCIDRREREKEL